eukprot:gb/GECG01007352.1/.p1 GENE.gb/GECG01007352.1/~~gb/GECG01007352.1/.p1  ORF type:complete len:482 (+),score=82.23 gb/GECG01007352.1/:1-1446(+)
MRKNWIPRSKRQKKSVKQKEQERAEQLETEAQRLKEERDELKTQLRDLESRLSVSSSSYESRISQLERDLTASKEETNRYRREIETQKEELEELRKRNRSLQEKESTLRSDVSAFQSQLEKTREKLSEALGDNNVASLRSQLESLQTENRRLQLYIEDQSSEISRLKEDQTEAIEKIRDQSRSSLQSIIRNSVRQAEDRIREEYSEELEALKKRSKDTAYDNEVLRRSIDRIQHEWSEKMAEMKGREESIREEGRREIDRVNSINTQLLTLLQSQRAVTYTDESWNNKPRLSHSPVRGSPNHGGYTNGGAPPQNFANPATNYLDQIEEQLKNLQTLGRSTLQSVSRPHAAKSGHAESLHDSIDTGHNASGMQATSSAIEHPDYLRSSRRVNLSSGTLKLLGSPSHGKRVSFHEMEPPQAHLSSPPHTSSGDQHYRNRSGYHQYQSYGSMAGSSGAHRYYSTSSSTWYSPGYWQSKYGSVNR